MKIMFIGSTDFSLSILQAIHRAHGVDGVITSKPKPRGRGLKETTPAIVRWCESAGITVHMPEDPNNGTFVNEQAALAPDLYVLAAYGRILRRELLDVPRLGAINIHPSLLPRYRGATPIQRAIMAGDGETGVTIIFMDEKIDHGEMIVQRSITIEPNDDYGSLASKLADLGASMLIDILPAVEAGTCPRSKQEGEVSYAPKLGKEEMLIDWTGPAIAIHNRIRALSPVPGARTRFRDKELILLKSKLGGKALAPGTLSVESRQLHVGASDGSIVLGSVKPEGKNVMEAQDFINGYRIRKGEVLG